MSWWDKQLINRLEEVGIEVMLYKRYVDDINIVLVAPDPKSEYVVNDETGRRELVINENSEARGKEENGVNLLKEIGNLIHTSIQLEVDHPSKH